MRLPARFRPVLANYNNILGTLIPTIPIKEPKPS